MWKNPTKMQEKRRKAMIDKAKLKEEASVYNIELTEEQIDDIKKEGFREGYKQGYNNAIEDAIRIMKE